MSDKLKIFCKNINRYVDISGGETLSEIFAKIADEIPLKPICAHVNNRTEDLSYPVFSPKQVEFLDAASAPGRRVYTRSLCMILYKAVHDIDPGVRLIIQHSIARGYYCRLLEPDSDRAAGRPGLSRNAILERMRSIVTQDIPFVRRERLTEHVAERYRAQGLDDKVLLLDSSDELYTIYYKLGDIVDSYYGALAPSTGHIDVFDLVPYKEGFLLMGRDPDNRDVPQQPGTQEKMYGAFQQYLRFNKVIKVQNVGELNQVVKDRGTALLINTAEAMHNKLIGRIADEITDRRRHGGSRFVFIAGPSSSGKTTSTKRLAIQLMTNLMTPKMISLDDYFIDRERTPIDDTGDYDYESLYALDLERLNSDLRRLLDGEQINLPSYSFELGRRIEKERPLKLEENDILLIEGIHGLNPLLTASIADSEKFKIYVSALTTLSVDDHNWIPTTDNRLLRRIVRDYKYRHTSALSTLRRWPSVRRGEEKWIFPFQENADAMFNSSLIFELGVMKAYAEPLLKSVPHNVPEFAEAYRLLRFLGHFREIPADQIPQTSLLREFLGGSSFDY